MRPSQGFGEQGNKGKFFRGTGEQRPKNKGNREHRQFSGTGNIENQDFFFGGGGGTRPFFSRGTREQVPSLGGPQL